MSNPNITTVQPDVPGRIIDPNEEVFPPAAGNNPTEGSSSSDDNDAAANSEGSTSSDERDINEQVNEPARTLNDRVEYATRRRDALVQERRLQSLEAEIVSLERGETPVGRSRNSGDDRSRSLATPGTKRTTNDAGLEYDNVVQRPRKTIRPEKLPIYHRKSVREHRALVRKANGAFRLTPENFLTEKDKIL